jgi:uncharacterized protein YdhG (YjbR/CyaY superfamily)
MAEVTDYIAGLDEPARSVLERYRARAMVVVPEAEDGTSYGMAALSWPAAHQRGLDEAGLLGVPVQPRHCRERDRRVRRLESTKGGIKFTDERHLPNKAFDALVARRRDAALSKPRQR